MADEAKFKPEFRLNPENGQPLASKENQAKWTVEHFKEFQVRQAMWADIMAQQKSKPVAVAAAAPAGSLAEKAAAQITAFNQAMKDVRGLIQL